MNIFVHRQPINFHRTSPSPNPLTNTLASAVKFPPPRGKDRGAFDDLNSVSELWVIRETRLEAVHLIAIQRAYTSRKYLVPPYPSHEGAGWPTSPTKFPELRKLLRRGSQDLT